MILIAVSLPLFMLADAANSKASDATAFARARRAPTLTIDGTANEYEVAFTENGSGSYIVDSDANVTATNSSSLKYATCTITNFVTGDTYSTSGLASKFVATNDGAGILTISNEGTFAEYLTALKLVKYLSTSDDPTAATREIEILVSNGPNDSNTCTASVVITPVNDAPALYMGGTATLDYDTAYVGGTTGIALCTTAVNIVDADDTYMESLTMLLSNAKTSDVLLTNEVDILGTFTVLNDTATPGAITVTLTGHRTIADFKAAAQLIKFYNAETSEIDTTGRVVYTVVGDGDVNSSNATTTITVTAPE